VRDSGCESGGSAEIGGFAVVDLVMNSQLLYSDTKYIYISETDISEANILNKRRVQIRALDELLQYRVHNIIKPSVLESTLGSLGHWSADRERDNDIVGVLLRAAKYLVRFRL
jgi:hypothetical protein